MASRVAVNLGRSFRLRRLAGGRNLRFLMRPRGTHEHNQLSESPNPLIGLIAESFDRIEKCSSRRYCLFGSSVDHDTLFVCRAQYSRIIRCCHREMLFACELSKRSSTAREGNWEQYRTWCLAKSRDLHAQIWLEEAVEIVDNQTSFVNRSRRPTSRDQHISYKSSVSHIALRPRPGVPVQPSEQATTNTSTSMCASATVLRPNTTGPRL